MNETIFNHIIQLEIQLLERVDSPTILAELIDEEFMEIGSSSSTYDKAEVERWLSSDDVRKHSGSSFQGRFLSDTVILLTYVSTLKDAPLSENKPTMRSSIWRLIDERWKMVFHQGTPLK